jgi:hypothetical protein
MTATSNIPQRIIQTAKNRELPLLARAAATNLKLLHPDWDYLFFDDEDIRRFIAQEFPQYQPVFDAFPCPIQRIDFFRYLAVFRLGGFYFDLDVFLSESVAGLLNHACVFPFEELTLSRFLRRQYGMDWEIGNYAFGAAPEHPFLATVIENCVRSQKDPAWLQPMMAGIPRLFRSEFYVLNTTGPGLVTRTLVENPDSARNVTVLFPADVCDAGTSHQFGHYGVHLMEASWRGRGSFLWCKLALAWEMRTRRRMLAESRTLGPTRIWPAAAGGGDGISKRENGRGMTGDREAMR